jgi:agmatinase
MSWYEVTELLNRVVARRKVVAFDIVELCPQDAHHASAFTAAKLLYRLVAMVLARG